jgi:hypothetical protein
MRIIPVRISKIDGRSPNVGGIVLRHVNHFRAGGYDLNDWPAAIVGVDYLCWEWRTTSGAASSALRRMR